MSFLLCGVIGWDRSSWQHTRARTRRHRIAEGVTVLLVKELYLGTLAQTARPLISTIQIQVSLVTFPPLSTNDRVEKASASSSPITAHFSRWTEFPDKVKDSCRFCRGLGQAVVFVHQIQSTTIHQYGSWYKKILHDRRSHSANAAFWMSNFHNGFVSRSLFCDKMKESQKGNAFSRDTEEHLVNLTQGVVPAPVPITDETEYIQYIKECFFRVSMCGENFTTPYAAMSC